MGHEVERKHSTRRDGPAWWTWLEAVEWVVFRGTEPPLPWPPGWIWRDLDSGTLAAVAARADTSLRPEERIYRPKREEWSGQSYQQRAKVKRWLRALCDAGVPTADLPARTRELADAARACDAERGAASSDLMAKIRNDRLPIFGQRPLPDARGNLTRRGTHQQIRSRVFADFGLVVQVDAVTVPAGSPRWWQEWNCRQAGELPALYPLYVGVRLRVQDVRRLWPANPPTRRTARKHVPADTLQKLVREWRAAERAAGRRPTRKRLDHPEQREKLGATRDALRDAYKAVCQAERIGPGRPPTKSAG